MNISYEGIGQWAATFENDGVAVGQMAKVSSDAKAAPCAGGDAFAGVVLSVSRDEAACSVALNGVVTVDYSGTAPAVGWQGLAADGNGGVKTAASGKQYLVIQRNETAKTVTFVL